MSEGLFMRSCRPAALWRYLAMVIFACLGLGLSIGGFVGARNREQQSLKAEFDAASHDRVAALREELDAHSFILESVVALYASSAEVTRREFQVFATPLLARHTDIQALEWIPRVPGPERAAYELAARGDGLEGFQITQRDSLGRTVPEVPRDEYFPVYFVEPLGGNELAVGFNLASEPRRLAALSQARDSGQPYVSEPITLVQEKEGQTGFLVYFPVYQKSAAIDTVQQRREHLRGFVLGVLRAGSMVEASFNRLAPAGVNMALYDDTNHAGPQLLHYRHPRTDAGAVGVPGDQDADRPAGVVYRAALDVLGRKWLVVCWPAPAFISAHTTVYPWVVLTMGLVFTLAVCRYLLGSMRQARRQTQLAEDLAGKNAALVMEMASRKQAESALLESEHRYRALFEGSRDALMTLAPPSWRFTSGNPATAAMFGAKDIAELLTLGPQDLSPETQPDGRPSAEKVGEMIERAMREGSNFFEWAHKRLNGEEFPALVLLTRIDVNGQVLLQATTRDITAQKLAEGRIARLGVLKEDLFRPGTLGEKLQRITDAVVDAMGADFARVWVTNPGDRCQSGCPHAGITEGPHVCRQRDRCLHLMASSGRYTHIDGGAHARVPFGCYKIGRIAAGQDKKFITNNVTHDSCVHDHLWAAELGLASLAGYRLVSPEGQHIGVLALFSRHPIGADDDAVLEQTADMTGRVIHTAKTEEKLSQTANLMRSIIDSSSDLIFVKDRNLRSVLCNEAFAKALGKHPSDLHGKTDIESGWEPELVRGNPAKGIIGFEQDDQDALSGKTVHNDCDPANVQGEIRVFDTIKIPLRGEDGEIFGVLGISRDVTERKRAEDTTRQAKAEAEQANAAKSAFLANMSHEIRTPMTAILGYTDLVAESIEFCVQCPGHTSCKVRAECKENLAVIQRNGRHLLAIINDILDLSKIEAGKMTVERLPCSVPALLAEVASIMRVRADEQGIALSVDCAGELPETIQTDEVRLRQALMNLVGNAIKFTKQGGVRIAASFLPAWRDGAPAVSIQVMDTGIGMSQEQIGKLFEPFTQADTSTSRKYGGTGLGLAITRRIVELLGGEITVESTLGQGSTFTLTVPAGSMEGVRMVRQPFESLKGDLARAPGPRVRTNALAGLRLLLAEDGPDNQRLISTILSKAGASVEVAANGRMAVEKVGLAGPGGFDAVLMDMQMPEMNGYEATQALRLKGYVGPILALTAHSMSSDREKCLAAGCNDYLSKPLDRRQLIAAVATWARKVPVWESYARTPGVAAPEPQAGVLASEFASDPEMASLMDNFVAGLSGQAASMRQAFQAGCHEELRRLAHQLKGAGGGYGYPSLTDAASVLEEAAKAADTEAEALALQRLAELCQAVLRGHRKRVVD